MTAKKSPARSSLTEKQKLFCQNYVRCFNATKAYQKAYGCARTTASVEGARTLAKPSIQAEIARLRKGRLEKALLTGEDVFQKMIDIAFADVTDYAEWTAEGVTLKSSDQVDGSLVSEVYNTAAGPRLKLADRAAALQWLADRFPELSSEMDKARIEAAKAKTQIETTETDDGFLEAIGYLAPEVWSDQEGDDMAAE